MNCEELQIDDWVECHGLNQKVKEISGLDNEAYLTMDECVDCTEVNPIPITPEILEKNGFVHGEENELKDDYHLAMNLKQIPHTVVEYTFYKNPIMGCDSLLRCWTKAPDCDGQNDAHLCNIEYVHELQHALRLCKINKEIKL